MLIAPDQLWVLHCLKKVAYDHALKFETTHVAVVGHHSQCFSNNFSEEVLIEHICILGVVGKHLSK